LAGRVARLTEMINAYKILARNVKGRELGESNGRWEDNIKMNLK